MKKRGTKAFNPGDILQMMVDSQSRPIDNQVSSEESQQEERGLLTPIVSIDGRDVKWHELEFNQPKKKDKAA